MHNLFLLAALGPACFKAAVFTTSPLPFSLDILQGPFPIPL